MDLVQIPLISDAAGRASAVARNRAKNRQGGLAKAHQKVISSGELFLRAVAIQNDLSSRILKQPMSRKLRSDQRKHERLVSQLAREYKNAMAEYLAAIRKALKY